MVAGYSARLVLTASPMGVAAVVFVVPPMTTVSAKGEGLAVDGVVARAVAPGTRGFVEPRPVGPRVVEVVATLLYLVSCHLLSWWGVE